MTPPARRVRFGGPKRATRANTAPAPPVDSQPRVRHSSARDHLLGILRKGPQDSPRLGYLLYGALSRNNSNKATSLIAELRKAGHVISHDEDGYHLVREVETNDAGRATRSPDAALYALFTTRGSLYKQCDCGAAATRVALFHQLTVGSGTRFINTLPICHQCAAAFTDAEQILTMEEAYAMANLPVPPPTEPGRPRGRPAAGSGCAPSSARRLGHGDAGDDAGPSD